jgi:hypothetical protein
VPPLLIIVAPPALELPVKKRLTYVTCAAVDDCLRLPRVIYDAGTLDSERVCIIADSECARPRIEED